MAKGADIVEVALALVHRQGRWLVSRRRSDDSLAGLWEFPGGKIEPPETPEMAAVRECLEEMGLAVEPVQRLGLVGHDYGHVCVRLHPIVCRCISDEGWAQARGCWVTTEELGRLAMPAGNAAIVAMIERLESPA